MGWIASFSKKNQDMITAIVRATAEVVTLKRVIAERNGLREWCIYEDDSRVVWDDQLLLVEDLWGEFLPRYMNCYINDARVTLSDDIQCCIDGDADDAKLQRVIERYSTSIERWQTAVDDLNTIFLREAATNVQREYNSDIRKKRDSVWRALKKSHLRTTI